MPLIDISPVQTDVLLVSMPFGVLDKPSIGLGLIKSHLDKINIPSKVLYFTLPFAKIIETSLYTRISGGEPATIDQLGEWLFSAELFPDTLPYDTYISDVLEGGNILHRGGNPLLGKHISQEFIRDALDIRPLIKPFLDQCLDYILAHKPKVVGFSSMFQQHTASLSLARRLKETDPSINIVFGGPNCEGAMGAETIKQFRFIDAVVSGEADAIIGDLMINLLSGQSIETIKGVYTYNNIDFLDINGHYPNGPSIIDMDSLPYPNYIDYFLQREACSLDFAVSLFFETSRGCWWGQSHHCVFCGLNPVTLGFRSKSGDRALTELMELQAAYPYYPIEVVDNIMDLKYFKSFVPQLAELNLDVRLFYEVKANLKKEQIRFLKEAGITKIQPGVESFSTAILNIMNKGVKALQNIQLLKWCKELGVEPAWNFLWGFPREDPAEYTRMAELLPLLTHLPPPMVAQRLHLDRFSPMFDAADSFGLVDITPFPSAAHIYREVPTRSLANLVYYFTYGYQDGRHVDDYVIGCAHGLINWKDVHATSDLYVLTVGDELQIWDLRPTVSQHVLTRLIGLERELYLACDAVQTIEQLRAIIERYLGTLSTDQARTLLQPFIDRGLMLVDGNSYLSLAVLATPLAAKYPVFAAMEQVLQISGRIPGYFQITEVEIVHHKIVKS
jgi:ribosomal peptide maturation radical SAM protein 1